MFRIGIDLGGTTVKAGIVDENCRILMQGSLPTSEKPEELIRDIIALTEGLMQKAGISPDEILSLGLGVPGTANRSTGYMEYANNLSFENVPLPAMLEEHFQKPTAFTNDANAAAWGEYLAGCGKGSRSLVMVTLGTGIGGGIILDGKLYEGCNYAAGEFGHFTIKYDGEPCVCGRRGCFEAYASATALIRMTKEALETGKESLLQKANVLDAKLIFDSAAAGDETSKQILDRYIYYLSIGITDLINIFQPEVLCIGGGISQAGDALMVPLRKLVDPMIYTRNSRVNTRIQKAALGNDAGIIGAAMLEA